MFHTNYRKESLLLIPPHNCLSIPCLNMTSEDTTEWIEICNYICYVILPVIIVLSLLGQSINILVLSKQVRLSLDTYFLVLSITTCVHVCTSLVIILPHYIDCVAVKATYYSILIHEWTQYVMVWIILSAALERTLTVTLYQTFNQVSPRQSVIIIALVICVGSISTVPRCWQYDVITNYNATNLLLQSNQSVIMKVGHYEEYNVIYFWYTTCLFTGLPFLLMLITGIALLTSLRSSRKHAIESKYRTNSSLILNRRLKEEIQLTRLIVKMKILYVFFMLPPILINGLYFLQVLDINDSVCITVSNVLSLFYHIFFVIQQQLYFCFNKQYRLTFIALCCCLC